MRYGTLIATLVGVAVLATSALAATSGYHFTNSGDPVCTDTGFTVTCSGEIAGLGNGDVSGDISAQGTVVGTTCTSPGGNEAPGQNPALPVSPTGTGDFGNPKNGRLAFSISTNAPTITAKQAGCPNNNWTASYTDVLFTTYSFTIRQGGVLYSCSGSFTRAGGSQDGDTSAPSCSPSN